MCKFIHPMLSILGSSIEGSGNALGSASISEDGSPHTSRLNAGTQSSPDMGAEAVLVVVVLVHGKLVACREVHLD